MRIQKHFSEVLFPENIKRERENYFLGNQLFHSLSVRQTGESVKNSAEIIEIGAWINGQRSLCCHKWRQVETRYLCALPVSKKSTILQQRLYDMSRHHVGWLHLPHVFERVAATTMM
ncbi:hypothetical protein TNCV_3607081 [Trichonephila clavipes]|nr:hypothetical protein TNCV_3607081 [Trichonephila clavipes]